MDTNSSRDNSIRYSDKKIGDFSTLELYIGLLIIWILVELWLIFFRNLSRKTFGLDEHNTVHSFAYALAISFILIGFVFLIGDSAQETMANIGLIGDDARHEEKGNDNIDQEVYINWDNIKPKNSKKKYISSNNRNDKKTKDNLRRYRN